MREGFNPLAGVLKKKTGVTQTHESSTWEAGGKDWSEPSASRGIPRIATTPRK